MLADESIIEWSWFLEPSNYNFDVNIISCCYLYPRFLCHCKPLATAITIREYVEFEFVTIMENIAIPPPQKKFIK